MDPRAETWRIGSSSELDLSPQDRVRTQGSSLWLLVRAGRVAITHPRGHELLEAGDAAYVHDLALTAVTVIEDAILLVADLHYQGEAPLPSPMVVPHFSTVQSGVISLMTVCPATRQMKVTRPGIHTAYGELLGSAMLAEHRSTHGRDTREVTRRDDVVARAAEAMAREPARAWTLADLAALTHVGTTTLVDRFREATALTPMQVLRRLRLQRASGQLLDTERSISQIAHATGYGSTEAFVRAFRAETGESPGRWRQSSRGRTATAAKTTAASAAARAPVTTAALTPR